MGMHQDKILLTLTSSAERSKGAWPGAGGRERAAL